MSLTNYQIYAVDKNEKIVHAGTTMLNNISIDICRKLERNWVRWRNEYVKNNPGEYPTAVDRRNKVKTVKYIVHPVGMPEKAMRIPLNGTNV